MSELHENKNLTLESISFSYFIALYTEKNKKTNSCFNEFILDQDYFIFKHHQTRPVQFQHNRFIFLSWTKSRVEIVKIKQTTFFKQLGKAQRSSLQRLGLTVSLIQITGMKINLDLHLQIWQPLVVNFPALGSVNRSYI